jgi:glycosyltransferase involved in cell wall biosynthesis
MIVQNSDDQSWLGDQLGIPESRISLIRGAGVDVDYYSPKPLVDAPSVPVVTLVARMLRDKGVVEFCEAARILKSRGVAVRFLLVGDPDPLNPTSLTEPELLDLTNIGVEYLGRSNDIKAIWHESDISVLPSYREGLPLSLLESAAMGKPIVTTDVPGCREVVDDGVNGFLVPPKDPEALANAIEKLAVDPDLRRQFGRASRERAVKEFSSDRVIADTLALYEYQ